MKRVSPLPGWRPRTEVGVLLLLTVLTLAAYGRVKDNDFYGLDDDLYITQNPHVLTGLSAENFRWAWTTDHAYNWHPLTWLSLQLDTQLFGPSPRTYHLVNLAFHVVNMLLLYAVLRWMTGAVWRSAVVAALFALHPLHVESVAWASERKDVLSACFWLLVMLAYAGYARRPGIWRYLLVVVLFALGLTAKPMLVTLPFVLLLLDYWPLERFSATQRTPVSVGRLVAEKVPLLILALICSLATVAAQERLVQSVTKFSPAARVLNALVSYVAYIGQLFWPVNLVAFYPHPGEAIPLWQAAGAALLLAVITGLVVWGGRRYPYLPVGWFWYVGTLVPVIGLVQVGLQARADRYSYIPLIGLSVLLVWGLADLFARLRISRPVVGTMTATALGVCAVLTAVQVGYWKDSITLLEHTLAVNTDNYRAHSLLGGALLAQNTRGRFAEAVSHLRRALELNPQDATAHLNLGIALSRRGDVEGAIREYEQALAINPEFAEAHKSLGIALSRQGKLDEAAAHLRRAVEIQPEYAEGQLDLGVVLIKQGKTEEAADHFTEAVRLWPNALEPRMNLGLALTRLGRFAEATEEFRAVVQIAPQYPDAAFQLGNVLARAGQADEAIRWLEQAVRLRSGDVRFRCRLAQALYDHGQTEAAAEQYAEATHIAPRWQEQLNRAARDLATNPDAQFRDGPLALELARQACQATGAPAPEYLDTLAATYAELGRFDEAIATLRRAITQAAKTQPDLMGPLRQRLDLYEHHRPYREDRGATRP